MKRGPASCSEAGGERPCPLKTLHNNPPSAPVLLSPWGAAPVSGAVIIGMPAACLQPIHTDPLCLSGPHRPPLSSSGGNIISKINAGATHSSLLPPLCLLASSTWHRRAQGGAAVSQTPPVLSGRGRQGSPARLLLSPVVTSLPLKCGLGGKERARWADRLRAAIPLLCDLGQTLSPSGPRGYMSEEVPPSRAYGMMGNTAFYE